MYASSFGMRNYSDKHMPTHYNDAATTQDARFNESGYRFKLPEMAQEPHHDLPEDVSKELVHEVAKGQQPRYRVLAAYTIIDVIDSLLREPLQADVRRNLALRTNVARMVLEPAEKYFEAKAESAGEDLVVTPRELSDKLNEIYSNFSITEDAPKKFYNALIRRWERIPNFTGLPHHRSYLSAEEREYISGTVRDFVEPTRKKVKAGEIVQSRDIESLVRGEHERIQSLLSSGRLEDVRQDLVLPTQVELLLMVKKNLYMNYVRAMMEAMVKDAHQYAASYTGPRGLMDDGYLYPGLGKFSDARDTATRMGPNMDNIISQFRKHRIILEEGGNAARILRKNGFPYQRLWGGMNFLYNGLVAEIDRLESHFQEGVKAQSNMKEDLGRIGIMRDLMKEFKPTKGLKPSSGLSKTVASIRTSLAL